MLEIIFAIEVGLALGFSINNFCELRRLDKRIDDIYKRLILQTNVISDALKHIGKLQKLVGRLMNIELEDEEDDTVQ